MAILKLKFYPDPMLNEECNIVEAFDQKLHTLLDDMADTMHQENGVGLAAPQIGVAKRITVIDISSSRSELQEFINPEIVDQEGSTSSEEGCLSIPDYRDIVKRNEFVEVHAYDRNGNKFKIEAEDLLSIVLQHEIDHLHGILFVDRLSRMKRELFKQWFKKQGDFE